MPKTYEEKKVSNNIKFAFNFLGPSSYFDYRVTNDKKLYITTKNSDPRLKKNLQKEIMLAETEMILDIVSWILDGPIKNYKKTSMPKIQYVDNYFINPEETIFNNKINSEKYDLLSAHREIQNESSTTLRYLMWHRLLELLAKRHNSKWSVDKLIKYYKIPTYWIKNKRNSKKQQSFPYYIRNKIHPTKNSFKFPYRALNSNEKMIRKIARTIISDFLKF